MFFPFNLEYRILRKDCQDEICVNNMGVLFYQSKRMPPPC